MRQAKWIGLERARNIREARELREEEARARRDRKKKGKKTIKKPYCTGCKGFGHIKSKCEYFWYPEDESEEEVDQLLED